MSIFVRGRDIMDLNDYQNEASSTFKDPQPLSPKHAAMLDWTLGIVDEAGEVAGVIKHHIFHNAPLDKMAVAKEIGDVLWYLSALCTSLEINIADCAELNICKLRHRHGTHYSHESSANRHERERKFEDTPLYEAMCWRILGLKGDAVNA